MINTCQVCCRCKTKLKKQTFGSNTIYYCPQCGTMKTINPL
ncbi:MAG: zf-TFIIB domain-containing protein [Methanomethylovorans sp.]|nr:zf-TFIIB domain-containing protein [Methanomethylovorans sp.]